MAPKNNNAKLLRDKTVGELEDHALKLRRDWFDNKLKQATRQLEDTSELRKMRRELARTLTVLQEKKNATVGA